MWKLFPSWAEVCFLHHCLVKIRLSLSWKGSSKLSAGCRAGCKLAQLSTAPLLNCQSAFTLLHRTYASCACGPRPIYSKAVVQSGGSKYLCSDRNNMLPLLAAALKHTFASCLYPRPQAMRAFHKSNFLPSSIFNSVSLLVPFSGSSVKVMRHYIVYNGTFLHSRHLFFFSDKKENINTDSVYVAGCTNDTWSNSSD